MAGQAIAIADGFPHARIIGVEPAAADDFRRSLAAGRAATARAADQHLRRVALLRRRRAQLADLATARTRVGGHPRPSHPRSSGWVYERHGLRTELLRAITLAALLSHQVDLAGDGDVVVVVSGRNVDEEAFRTWIAAT